MKKLLNNDFIKNVAILSSGTFVAQLLSVASLPIISRLYSPSDYGMLSICLSIAGIFSVIATGKYELAIMLPKTENAVTGIIGIIFRLSILIVALFTIVLVVLNQEISVLLKNPLVGNWLYFVPFLVFLMAQYQAVYYLLIRTKNFKKISSNNILINSIRIASQFVLFPIIGGIGLLFGVILSYLSSFLLLIRVKGISEYYKSTNSTIRDALKEYKAFPLVDLPSTMLNLIANQLPIIALSRLFGAETLGYYAFMNKILVIPTSLLSKSVLDVFKQRATQDYQKDGNFHHIFVKTFKSLALIGLLPLILFLFFSPYIFSFAFGAKWQAAGLYAQIAAPMMYLCFVANPLSYSFYIVQKQIYNLIGQIILLVLVASAILLSKQFNNVKYLIAFFSIAYSIVYLFYIVISYKLSKGSSK